ncbi:ventral expressed homeobox [Leucoraja erinacea]|uniref:ventral expressed homeobox n=1 Tax=Leucoraja erinaceus TaxID=7782 RepID=UPI0024559737|nr:ventral expressed homeobox [Leucoraja erinacea]
MLEAAFSVEWLARSSRPGEHGRDQGSHSLPGEQAADQADLSTAETPHGRDTANNSEESDRSLTNIDQGFKTQRRPLETHAGAACSGGDTESRTGDWAERRRLRTIFTVEQVRSLEFSFQRQQYPGSFVRRTLAGELRLSEAQVKTWFQNRRMKLKQQLQVAQAEALKSRLFLQYFPHPYHSIHGLSRVADSSSFHHCPESGPLRSQTCISDRFLQCLDYQPSLPHITPKAIANRFHPRLSIE